MDSTNTDEQPVSSTTPTQTPCEQQTVKKVLTSAARLAKQESESRVNIGRAFEPWRELRSVLGMDSDPQLASFLLDSYLRRTTEEQPEQLTVDRGAPADTSVDFKDRAPMNSSSEDERGTHAAPSVQSSEQGKESGEEDAACQRSRSQEEFTSANQSENRGRVDEMDPHTDVQEDEDEVSISLSVGDGRYLVDLGSSSELVVDEECILQLFKSCPECNRQCTVRKHVKGLKLVVYQACCFCQSRRKWTNLPDDDDGDFQTNGKDAAQTSSATSPSSNTS